MLGQTLSHYHIVSELGSGGMGVVYCAEDTRLGRRVALKLLPDGLSRDAQALERFQREARAASALSHPHIRAIFDVDESGGRRFLVMELLEGESLKDRLGRGPLPIEQVLDFGMQIAQGLHAAHQHGIIHRDLKPANIFLVSGRHAKILDFGLAKLSRRPVAQLAGASDTPTYSSDGLTQPGTALGTIGYMSPEQARGQEVDARSDLFSLGAVLYEMATGRAAFGGGTSAVIFDAILNRQPLPPLRLNPGLPPELERILAKALEKDPALRYQSAAEIEADLRRVKRDSSAPLIEAQPALPDELRLFSRPVARGLLLLIQAMYALFYVLALARLEAVESFALRMLPGAPFAVVALVLVSALLGLAVRLYLVTAVAADYRPLGEKFHRLFPFLLPLDELWALSPFLAVNKLGLGLAFAATVGLVYLPFSQRLLVRNAYPTARDSGARLSQGTGSGR